jgi:hypothetical protein
LLGRHNNRPPRGIYATASWQTSSPMPYKSNSAASDVSLARFDLRIIRAMQPSAAGDKTAECVANQSSATGPADAS